MDKSCKSVIKYFLSHGDTAKCFYNSEYVYQTKKTILLFVSKPCRILGA